jgi:hypothetical protein
MSVSDGRPYRWELGCSIMQYRGVMQGRAVMFVKTNPVGLHTTGFCSGAVYLFR